MLRYNTRFGCDRLKEQPPNERMHTMCKRTRLDKFTRRLRAGDFGYCTHRLRKASRRKSEAVTAAGYALEAVTNGDVDLDSDGPLLEGILEFKDDLIADGNTTYAALASLVFRNRLDEQAKDLITNAPDDQLLAVVKAAVTDGDEQLAILATNQYLGVREDGVLVNALGKAKQLQTLFRELGSGGSALAKAKEWLNDRIAWGFSVDAYQDFLKIFEGNTPAEIQIADDCDVTCEFGNQHFASFTDFKEWLDGLIEDRGPLAIERTDAFEIKKEESYIPDADTWLLTSVAVVRDPNRDDALFVVLIGNDIADGRVKKVWLSTNNRIWNCPFEAPMYKEKTVTVSRNFTVDAKAAEEAGEQCRDIRPDDPNRTTRANELASKILEWATTPSEKCFRQAVWAIAVDALFDKTVFVPSTLTKYGSVKARGPVGPDGRRFYVAFVDCPNDGSLYTELKLSSFLATALDDDKTIGVGFKLVDGSKLLVRRDTLDELAAKVGPDLTGGEEVNDA